MRRANRRDSTHSVIVEDLRRVGFTVADTSRVGDDFPDLVVSSTGRNVLVEVKASDGKLTEGQSDFARAWRGPVIVARSAEDVIEYFNSTVEAA